MNIRKIFPTRLSQGALLMLLALSFVGVQAASAAETAESHTPNEGDIPRPVPVPLSLAGDPRPDVSRFLNVQAAWAPSLSPDGSQMAFRTEITGQSQLWVADVAGGWPRQLTFGEAVVEHAWAPDGDSILYSTDRGGNGRVGFYVIAPDGMQEDELMAPSEAFRVFGSFTADGRKIVYSTTGVDGHDFDIHLFDRDAMADQKILPGRMGLYPGPISPDGSRVLLVEIRGEDAADLSILNLATGTEEIVFRPDDRAAHFAFAWLPDSSGFFLLTDQDREMTAVAFYDLESQRLRWVETPAERVSGLELTGGGRYLAWVVEVEGYSELFVRDLETGNLLEVPPLPKGVYGLEGTLADPTIAIEISGPQLPGDIWTLNPATLELRRVTHSSPAGLDLTTLSVPTHHSFPASDGTTVHGYLYRPRQIADGALNPPVVIQVHGGPTSHARPYFKPVAQYLVSRGIAVFDLNYRGSTGYGRSLARLNDGWLRENELLDLTAALDFLPSVGIDSSRAAIEGGSYGGYLVMAGLARLPERFAAGVASVGVANWITALEGASPGLQASDRIEFGDIHDPADREFFAQLSPLTHVANVRAPIMMIHGANDPQVPVGESDQFVSAIRAAGGIVEYLRFPDEGHSITKLENRLIAYRRMAAFLEDHLRLSGKGASPN
jgi:dipeptidyl aminopeptidase/acylaminoacyl peptidase